MLVSKSGGVIFSKVVLITIKVFKLKTHPQVHCEYYWNTITWAGEERFWRTSPNSSFSFPHFMEFKYALHLTVEAFIPISHCLGLTSRMNVTEVLCSRRGLTQCNILTLEKKQKSKKEGHWSSR